VAAQTAKACLAEAQWAHTKRQAVDPPPGLTSPCARVTRATRAATAKEDP